jgi:transposase
MLSFNASQRYYLSVGGVDMRKSYNGLSGVVRQGLGRDPLSGEVFIFMNRRRMIMKLLVWDRSGWVIWSKRLEVGTFELPRRPADGQGLQVRWEELVMILEGVKLGSVRKRKRYTLEEKRAPLGQ